ncbi:MAG: hypothetical protein GY778_12790, partial [bacterium]|nr:hypothetical protein [bacterium]
MAAWTKAARAEVRVAVTCVVRDVRAGPPAQVLALPLVPDRQMDEDDVRQPVAVPAIWIPVAWPSFGGVTLTGKIEPGDRVLAIVRDRDHTTANEGGTDQVAASARRFNLADAIAIPMDSGAKTAEGPTVNLPPGDFLRIGGETASNPLVKHEQLDAYLTELDEGLAGLVGGAPPT